MKHINNSNILTIRLQQLELFNTGDYGYRLDWNIQALYKHSLMLEKKIAFKANAESIYL